MKNEDLPELMVLKNWLRKYNVEANLKVHSIQNEIEGIDCLSVESILFMPSHQLVVTGRMGKISVIHAGVSFNQYEIYCLEGDLFGDIRRYKTVEDTGKIIVKLLDEGLFDESVS